MKDKKSNGKTHFNVTPDTITLQYDAIISRDYAFKDLKVTVSELIDSSLLSLGNGRSWEIKVIKGTNTMNRKFYRLIEALGGFSGLMVPKKQPSDKYFTIIKFGDYDGNLIMIRQNGTINTYKGGPFFSTMDKKYLITEYDSDCAGLSVFDLEKDSLLFQKDCWTESDYYESWLTDGENIYWLGNYGEPDSTNTYVLDYVDFGRQDLIQRNKNRDELNKLRKISFDFDPFDKNCCM